MTRRGTTRLFVLVVLVFLNTPADAAVSALPAASITITPASGTFSTDSTFDVSIMVDTAGETVNAVDITLRFPADKLQVVTPSTGNSFISLWLQQPSFSNRDGFVHFAGGVPGQGIRTSSGLVSTITFRAKEPGAAVLRIDDKSTVHAGDGSGFNILKTAGRAQFTIIPKAPGGPTVFSVTHPDQESWYRDNNIVMGWDREPGSSMSYSYVLDHEPSGIPDNIDDTSETTASFPDVADGIWYFHVKQKKNGIYGQPSHYRIKIDNTAPADFKPVIETIGGAGLSRPAQVTFFTSDALSGIDHYEIAVFDDASETGAAPIFIEASSPYRIPDIDKGSARVVIRAFDVAGNTRDGIAEFKAGNFFLLLVRENYIGLILAAIMLGILVRHILLRHRSAVQQKTAAAFTRHGNFV